MKNPSDLNKKKPQNRMKILALLLTFSLGFSDSLALAQSVLHPQAPLQSSFEISPDQGKITEVFRGRPDKTILYLEDAHHSLEAQENIARIIRHAVARHGVRTVYEEGFEGPLDTDKYFGSVQDPVLREKLAYFLMDRLRLSGAEYAHINRSTEDGVRSTEQLLGTRSPVLRTDFELIGADSIRLHLKNVDWYRRSAATRRLIEKDLNRLGAEFDKIIHRRFPAEARRWLKLKNRLEKDQMPFTDYLRRLVLEGVKDHAVKPQDFPGIGLVLRAGSSGEREILEQLSQMDARELLDETRRFEKTLRNRWLTSPRDKQIWRAYEYLCLLKRLNAVQLSEPEFETVRKTLRHMKTRELGLLIVRETGKPLVLPKIWEQNLNAAAAFYETAKAREAYAAKQLDTFLKNPEQKTAVLVFGGFHAANLKRMMRERRISYTVVTPIIREIEKHHEEQYRKLMSGGHYDFENPLYLSTAAPAPKYFELIRAGRISMEAFQQELPKWAALAENAPLARSEVRSLPVPSLKKDSGKTPAWTVKVFNLANTLRGILRTAKFDYAAHDHFNTNGSTGKRYNIADPSIAIEPGLNAEFRIKGIPVFEVDGRPAPLSQLNGEKTLRHSLRTLATEFLHNAVREMDGIYNGRGPVAMKAEIQGEFLVLTVQDENGGIPEEVIEKKLTGWTIENRVSTYPRRTMEEHGTGFMRFYTNAQAFGEKARVEFETIRQTQEGLKQFHVVLEPGSKVRTSQASAGAKPGTRVQAFIPIKILNRSEIRSQRSKKSNGKRVFKGRYRHISKRTYLLEIRRLARKNESTLGWMVLSNVTGSHLDDLALIVQRELFRNQPYIYFSAPQRRRSMLQAARYAAEDFAEQLGEEVRKTLGTLLRQKHIRDSYDRRIRQILKQHYGKQLKITDEVLSFVDGLLKQYDEYEPADPDSLYAKTGGRGKLSDPRSRSEVRSATPAHEGRQESEEKFFPLSSVPELGALFKHHGISYSLKIFNFAHNKDRAEVKIGGQWRWVYPQSHADITAIFQHFKPGLNLRFGSGGVAVKPAAQEQFGASSPDTGTSPNRSEVRSLPSVWERREKLPGGGEKVFLKNVKGNEDVVLEITEDFSGRAFFQHAYKIKVLINGNDRSPGSVEFKIFKCLGWRWLRIEEFYPLGEKDKATYRFYRGRGIASTVLNYLANRAKREFLVMESSGTREADLLHLYREFFAEEKLKNGKENLDWKPFWKYKTWEPLREKEPESAFLEVRGIPKPLNFDLLTEEGMEKILHEISRINMARFREASDHLLMLQTMLGFLEGHRRMNPETPSLKKLLGGNILNIAVEDDTGTRKILPSNLVSVLRARGFRVKGLSPALPNDARKGYVQGYMQDISMFPDHTFDTVLIFGFFDNVYPDLIGWSDEDTQKTLSELKRIVRPGGFILLSVMDEDLRKRFLESPDFEVSALDSRQTVLLLKNKPVVSNRSEVRNPDQRELVWRPEAYLRHIRTLAKQMQKPWGERVLKGLDKDERAQIETVIQARLLNWGERVKVESPDQRVTWRFLSDMTEDLIHEIRRLRPMNGAAVKEKIQKGTKQARHSNQPFAVPDTSLGAEVPMHSALHSDRTSFASRDGLSTSSATQEGKPVYPPLDGRSEVRENLDEKTNVLSQLPQSLREEELRQIAFMHSSEERKKLATEVERRGTMKRIGYTTYDYLPSSELFGENLAVTDPGSTISEEVSVRTSFYQNLIRSHGRPLMSIRYDREERCPDGYMLSNAYHEIDHEYVLFENGTFLDIAGIVPKVLVLDADQVLWQGILVEDGLEGIQITEPFVNFQKAVLELKRRGIILALSSKNDEVLLHKALNEKPGMVLHARDFLAIKADWRSKADHLAEITKQLGLSSVQALVFLDDSPTERGMIHMRLPSVNAPELPLEPAQRVPFLNQLFLKKSSSTYEDANRAKSYENRKKRILLEALLGSHEDLLHRLNLQAVVREGLENADFLPRIASLTERTNQFNAKAARYSENEVKKRLKSHDFRFFTLELTDIFENLGVVGVLVLRRDAKDPRVWHMDMFCVSCRAFGFGVEHALFAWAADRLKQEGAHLLKAGYVASGKNQRVQTFFESSGFGVMESRAPHWHYLVSLDSVQTAPPVWMKILSKAEALHGAHHEGTVPEEKDEFVILRRFMDEIGLESSIRTLAKAVTDHPDDVVKEIAAEMLTSLGSPTIPILAGFLPDQSPFRYSKIILEMNPQAWQGHGSMLRPIENSIVSKLSSKLRVDDAPPLYAKILGEIGGTQAMAVFQDVLLHNNPAVRSVAVSALEKGHWVPVNDFQKAEFLFAKEGESEFTRRGAVYEDSLIKELQNGNESAARLLGLLGSLKAVPLVMADQSLGRIFFRNVPHQLGPSVISVLAELCFRQTDNFKEEEAASSARGFFIHELGGIPVPILIEKVENQDPVIRKRALEWLFYSWNKAEWQPQGEKELLVDLFIRHDWKGLAQRGPSSIPWLIRALSFISDDKENKKERNAVKKLISKIPEAGRVFVALLNDDEFAWTAGQFLFFKTIVAWAPQTPDESLALLFRQHDWNKLLKRGPESIPWLVRGMVFSDGYLLHDHPHNIKPSTAAGEKILQAIAAMGDHAVGPLGNLMKRYKYGVYVEIASDILERIGSLKAEHALEQALKDPAIDTRGIVKALENIRKKQAGENHSEVRAKAFQSDAEIEQIFRKLDGLNASLQMRWKKSSPHLVKASLHLPTLSMALGRLRLYRAAHPEAPSLVTLLGGRILNAAVEDNGVSEGVAPLNLVSILRPKGFNIVGLSPALKDDPAEGYVHGKLQDMRMFPDHSFDTVMIMDFFDPAYRQIIGWTEEDTEKAIAELKRVVKPGGYILLTAYGEEKIQKRFLEDAGFEAMVLDELRETLLLKNKSTGVIQEPAALVDKRKPMTDDSPRPPELRSEMRSQDRKGPELTPEKITWVEKNLKTLYRGIKTEELEMRKTAKGVFASLPSWEIKNWLEILKALPHKRWVLDPGSGRGYPLLAAAMAFPDSDFIGIEDDTELVRVSRDIVRYAESMGWIRPGQVVFRRGDFNDSLFDEDWAKADTVFYYELGTEDVAALARTMSRSLKPGAQVITYGAGMVSSSKEGRILPLIDTGAFLRQTTPLSHSAHDFRVYEKRPPAVLPGTETKTTALRGQAKIFLLGQLDPYFQVLKKQLLDLGYKEEHLKQGTALDLDRAMRERSLEPHLVVVSNHINDGVESALLSGLDDKRSKRKGPVFLFLDPSSPGVKHPYLRLMKEIYHDPDDDIETALREYSQNIFISEAQLENEFRNIWPVRVESVLAKRYAKEWKIPHAGPLTAEELESRGRSLQGLLSYMIGGVDYLVKNDPREQQSFAEMLAQAARQFRAMKKQSRNSDPFHFWDHPEQILAYYLAGITDPEKLPAILEEHRTNGHLIEFFQSAMTQMEDLKPEEMMQASQQTAQAEYSTFRDRFAYLWMHGAVPLRSEVRTPREEVFENDPNDFDRYGVAKTETGWKIALGLYQEAFNRFMNWSRTLKEVQGIPNPFSRVSKNDLVMKVQFSVEAVRGSLSRGMGRIGVFPPWMNFKDIHDALLLNKGFEKMGVQFALSAFHVPSDIDVDIGYRAHRTITLEESFKVDDLVKAFCRHLFEDLGVFIHAGRHELYDSIPPSRVEGEGLFKIFSHVPSVRHAHKARREAEPTLTVSARSEIRTSADPLSGVPENQAKAEWILPGVFPVWTREKIERLKRVLENDPAWNELLSKLAAHGPFYLAVGPKAWLSLNEFSALPMETLHRHTAKSLVNLFGSRFVSQKGMLIGIHNETLDSEISRYVSFQIYRALLTLWIHQREALSARDWNTLKSRVHDLGFFGGDLFKAFQEQQIVRGIMQQENPSVRLNDFLDIYLSQRHGYLRTTRSFSAVLWSAFTDEIVLSGISLAGPCAGIRVIMEDKHLRLRAIYKEAGLSRYHREMVQAKAQSLLAQKTSPLFWQDFGQVQALYAQLAETVKVLLGQREDSTSVPAPVSLQGHPAILSDPSAGDAETSNRSEVRSKKRQAGDLIESLRQVFRHPRTKEQTHERTSFFIQGRRYTFDYDLRQVEPYRLKAIQRFREIFSIFTARKNFDRIAGISIQEILDVYGSSHSLDVIALWIAAGSAMKMWQLEAPSARGQDYRLVKWDVLMMTRVPHDDERILPLSQGFDDLDTLPERSEIRFSPNQGTPLTSSVVAVLQAKTIQAMSAPEWLELLALKALHKDQLHILIAGETTGSSRIQELKTYGRVYAEEQAASLPARSFCFYLGPSGANWLKLKQQIPDVVRRIKDHKFLTGSGVLSAALRYAAQDGDSARLAMKRQVNGFWAVDPSFAGQLIQELFRQYEVISLAA